VEEVFVDTGYCLALFNPRDSLRDRALKAEEILPKIVRMVTSDLVEIEVLNALSRERQEIKNEAILLFKTMREDPTIWLFLQHAAFLNRLKECI
jgi:predicted nucleic acid-binding protein